MQLLDRDGKRELLLLDQALLVGAHRKLERARDGPRAGFAGRERNAHGCALLFEFHGVTSDFHTGKLDPGRLVQGKTVRILLVDLERPFGIEHDLHRSSGTHLVGATGFELEVVAVFADLRLRSTRRSGGWCWGLTGLSVGSCSLSVGSCRRRRRLGLRGLYLGGV